MLVSEAIFRQDCDAVTKAVKEGYDLNSTDGLFSHLVETINFRPEMIECLIKNGADPNKKIGPVWNGQEEVMTTALKEMEERMDKCNKDNYGMDYLNVLRDSGVVSQNVIDDEMKGAKEYCEKLQKYSI